MDEDVELTNETILEILRNTQNLDPELVYRYISNRAIDEPAYTALIVAYSVLIVVGALGNTLVVS